MIYADPLKFLLLDELASTKVSVFYINSSMNYLYRRLTLMSAQIINVKRAMDGMIVMTMLNAVFSPAK
jgi:hypothetical protein